MHPRYKIHRHRVAFIVYSNIKLLDLAGPLQAFSDALSDDGLAVYETTILSIDGKPVKSDTQVSLPTEPINKWARRKIDTLIVVGGNGAKEASKDGELLKGIKTLAARSNRVGSICSGAFVLAACGLLNGHRVVTHWESCEELAVLYPELNVEPDPIFINDNNIWTSAGVTAGLDMALAMIAKDIGRVAALNLARSLVTYIVRPGGQSQFSEPLNLQIADESGKFDNLHQWIRNNLDKDLRVEALASQSTMSPRNFARLYASHTKQTPAKAVESIRVEEACRMLGIRNLSIKHIARQCGFSGDEMMKRSFIRLMNVTPSDFRKRFIEQKPNTL